VTVLVIIVVSFTSCSGLNDWEYSLPGGYAVIKINSQNVVFSKVESDGTILLSRFITDFCYNDSYIALKRIPMDNIDRNEMIDIDSYDLSMIEYYLVNIESDELLGPFNFDEYTEKIVEFKVGELCEWTNTKSRPKSD